MADTKLTNLTAETTPAAADLFYLVKAAGGDRKATLANLFAALLPGLDDQATGERLQIGDNTMVFGASGQDYVVINADNGQSLFFSGGNAANVGGNFILRGGAHASGGDLEFRTGTTTTLLYDVSNSWWNWGANTIYNVGDMYIGGTGTGNQMDIYEDGAWTPGISFGGGTTGITYTSQTGRYVRAGNGFYAYGYISLSAVGSSTGSARITGLPFTLPNTTAGLGQGGVVVRYSGMTTISSAITVSADINTTTAFLWVDGASATANMTEADFTSSSVIEFSMYFEAA